MGVAARVSLPGYDALSDTNIDHFSLYSDIDNILIKRALTTADYTPANGASSYTIPGSTTITITHNLGYVPFFIVYVKNGSGDWIIVNNEYNPFSVPLFTCNADTTTLSITNNDPSSHLFCWDIFYDDMVGNAAPSIIESSEVFKISRPNVNALSSKNPNDYIMHSDLNNFKILKQGTVSLPFTSSSQSISFSHNALIQDPAKYFLFIKTPDGKAALTGTAYQYSYDETLLISSSINDTTLTASISYPSLLHFPTAAVDDGSGSAAWNSPASVEAADGTASYASLLTSGTIVTNYIKATNFNFAIPSNATIVGIQLDIDDYAFYNQTSPQSQVFDAHIHLLKGGVEVGSDYANTTAAWQTTNTFITYGGQTNLWGTTWTPADINNSGFGVRLQATIEDASGNGNSAYIDDFRLTIYYQVPATSTGAYIISGSGKDGTINNTSPLIAITKKGKDVKSATNPDDFNFHSDYPTLKYYPFNNLTTGVEGPHTITNTTVWTIAHNLGYIPFFIGFINDFARGTNTYCILPFYEGNTPFPQPPADIAASIYADSTNIYLKVRYDPQAVGRSLTVTFYYKIFKNNLGI